MEQRPVLVTSEQKQKFPILIIDKTGLLGTALAEKLQEQFLIVLVSGRELEVHRNIIHIPYRKRIPLIPDNTYSHMFVIYNGEEEILDILPSFVKKSDATNSKLLFLTHLSNSSEKLTRRLSHPLYHRMQVVVYGELFGDKQIEENGVSHFIAQVRSSGRIAIPNSGLGQLYPVLFDEVLAVIIIAAFGMERKTLPVLIYPKHGITELSVARMLQKINPLLKIDFKKSKTLATISYLPHGHYYFENYDLEDRLRKLDLKPAYTPTPLPQKKRLHFSMPKRKKKNDKAFLLIGLFFFILLPFLSTLLFVGVGMASLHFSVGEAEKTNFANASQYSDVATTSFKTADTIVESFLLLDLVAKQQKDSVLRQIRVSEQLSEITHDSVSAAILLQNISQDKSTDPKNDFLHATATLKNTLLVVQKLQAEDELPEVLKKKLHDVNDMLALIENTVDTYPALLGFEGKRKYLVLFQNNMELRPAGGFIGSYGILNIEKGEIIDFNIHDVYDADGKLSDHIEPPYPLRRYLGASHWYLRDSNFALDFPTSAAQASNFLKLETGESVDGVIAIDTDFLRNMLGVFGSVTLPDYKETVTPDNFYLLTQTHAEKDFFPGSTQKKDFLRSLANALLAKFTESKKLPYQLFLNKIGESVKQKHLLFAFPDPATQQLFTVNNLSSSLWDGRKKEQPNTFLDFMGVIDANVGTNKANYYLSRALQQDVAINDKGEVTTTVKVTYENTSRKGSPFGGDYKNYVRFLIPAKASLQTVSFDNRAVAKTRAITDPADFTRNGFVPPRELEVDETQTEGKTSVGFFVIVPAGTIKSFSITYTLPAVINTQSSAFTYNLRVFKQPGTRQDPFSLFVGYPASYRLVKAGAGIADVGGKLSYSTQVSEDTIITAEFSKK